MHQVRKKYILTNLIVSKKTFIWICLPAHMTTKKRCNDQSTLSFTKDYTCSLLKKQT